MTKAICIVLLLELAGCGYTPGERALTGGALGAGLGAGVAGLSGGSMGMGALIGGGAGALGGLLTAPQRRH